MVTRAAEAVRAKGISLRDAALACATDASLRPLIQRAFDLEPAVAAAAAATDRALDIIDSGKV
jgi:hypothetical protein